MKTVLMVAEKPALANSISSLLSDRSASSRRGSVGSCSVYEWIGSFRPPGRPGETVKFRMTSVCGHVLTTDFLPKYNNWSTTNPIDLFDAPIEKKEVDSGNKMRSFLRQEAKGIDALVLWLDCDKEGENICFEVINAVHMERSSHVYRAKFSSITEKDIKAAMGSLGYPDENASKSVDARQELDLRIGCAFTRFQTDFFQNKYGDLDAALISYGPCQTPTLGFCVERHDQIKTFKPEPYWVLQTSAKTKNESLVKLNWSRVRLFDREVIQMFHHELSKEKYAVVTRVTKDNSQSERPLALNTVELMKVASSSFGMSPHSAMYIAEQLYIRGYISYPRTESTHYHENFNIKGLLNQLQSVSCYNEYITSLLSMGSNKPRKGHDAGDHPPITPTQVANKDHLDVDQWRIYDYVVRHFLGTVSYNLKMQNTTVHLSIGEEKFSFTKTKLVDRGYTAIMTWKYCAGEEEGSTSLVEGDSLEIHEMRIEQRSTDPPGYLTESDLISLMEKHGIGTDASIPVHINNIVQRGYVSVEAGRRLVPKILGIVLVHGYQKIDPDLVHFKMRSAVEKQLELIAKGQEDFLSVLTHTIQVFKAKFSFFINNIDGMDQLFEVSFSPVSESGKPYSKCGKCHRYMKLIEAHPTRLYCSACDETLALPKNINIKVYQELRCPLDDYEILYYSSGAKGKSSLFCPYCYNNPPFKGMKKEDGCNLCEHPSCPHGKNANGVSKCVECDTGVLVLDPSSYPKWKLGCNVCDVIVRLFDDAFRVSLFGNDVCPECEARLCKVEYKEGKSKLPSGSTSATGCIFCDEDLKGLVEKHKAVLARKKKALPSKNVVANKGRKKGGGVKKKGPPKDKMSKLATYFV